MNNKLCFSKKSTIIGAVIVVLIVLVRFSSHLLTNNNSLSSRASNSCWLIGINKGTIRGLGCCPIGSKVPKCDTQNFYGISKSISVDCNTKTFVRCIDECDISTGKCFDSKKSIGMQVNSSRLHLLKANDINPLASPTASIQPTVPAPTQSRVILSRAEIGGPNGAYDLTLIVGNSEPKNIQVRINTNAGGDSIYTCDSGFTKRTLGVNHDIYVLSKATLKLKLSQSNKDIIVQFLLNDNPVTTSDPSQFIFKNATGADVFVTYLSESNAPENKYCWLK